ncbi:MAG: hypothetical protein QW478_06060 [Candidatus Micrarchaeaceae archaeon]
MEKQIKIAIAILIIPAIFLLYNFVNLFTGGYIQQSAGTVIPSYWLNAMQFLNNYTIQNPNASMFYNIANDNPTNIVTYNYYAIGIACASAVALIFIALKYRNKVKADKVKQD